MSMTTASSGVGAAARKIVCSCLDAVDSMDPRTPPYVPPRRLNYNAGFTWSRRGYLREFVESGSRHARMLVDCAGLRPDSAVLDIGSGFGRVAAGLTSVLSPAGSYLGLDMHKQAIDWCRQEYAHLPNFDFQHLDVQVTEQLYSGNASDLDPAQASLPCPDEHFDVVYSISLFTHMRPEGVLRYLEETTRVLKPDGTALHTFLVVDDHALEAIAAGRAKPLAPLGDGVYARDPVFVEHTAGYSPERIRAMLEETGLAMAKPILFGSWSGRENSYIYQDIVVAKRVA